MTPDTHLLLMFWEFQIKSQKPLFLCHVPDEFLLFCIIIFDSIENITILSYNKKQKNCWHMTHGGFYYAF